MFRTFVLLVALFALSAVAKPFDVINGSIPIGTLSANKWNQTSFTLNPEVGGVPISSIWFYFADINTAKPLPTTIFQRGSITLTTSNQSLSVYNALTDSLNVPRVFPAAYPLYIPTGTLTVKASWALAVGQPEVSATLSWAIVTTDPTALYAQHANMMVASWSSNGVYSSSVTAVLPYDGLLVWAVGNILSGGQSVVIQNNSTGAAICTSAVSVSGDMQPCTPNTQIPQGTKITVTVHANGTFEPNAGGADLYIVKVPPPPTTTTTTAAATHSTSGVSGTSGATATHSTGGTTASGPATTATHSTGATASGPSTHSTSGVPATSQSSQSSSPHSSGGTSSGSGGPSGSGGSTGQSTQSTTQSTGASSTTSSVSMGYSSGSSGSGGGTGGNGFLADVDSIFVQKFDNKRTKIVINDVKERDTKQVLDIAEIDELPSADADHFRVTEEKASQKFL
jgi:hypothetical protein